MLKEGKYTIETFARENNLGRQSALNRLSRLKRLGMVGVSGGGRQKRIYSLYRLPRRKTNGFYDVVNRYSPEKLQPAFEHYVTGKYSVEHAIIDGITIGGARTREATKYLFRHVRDWKQLFGLAKKHRLEKQVIALYRAARETTKTRRMPKRYLR